MTNQNTNEAEIKPWLNYNKMYTNLLWGIEINPETKEVLELTFQSKKIRFNLVRSRIKMTLLQPFLRLHFKDNSHKLLKALNSFWMNEECSKTKIQ
jgi:hypothetical protein